MGYFAFGHFGMPLHEKRGCVGNASRRLRRGAGRGRRSESANKGSSNKGSSNNGIARTAVIGSMGRFVFEVFFLLFFVLYSLTIFKNNKIFNTR
jgi:hypothetical protein